MRKRKRGQLTIIGGPMFAGKTTKMLAIYDVLTKLGYSVMCFKSEVNAGGGIGHTNSHDERALPVLFINPNNPEKILKHLRGGTVKKVMIDSVQFFPKAKIKSVVDKLLSWGIDVYANGLIYDFRKKEFGATLDLMKQADEKIKLYAVCVRCGRRASHTERVRGGLKQKISTKRARYIPVCRQCHQVYKGK